MAPAASPHVTRTDIADGLRATGLKAGMNVVVHSSLSSLGRVEGGPDTVIDALQEVLGPGGTLVMPTFSGGTLYFLEALALRRGINGDGSGNGLVFDGSVHEFFDALVPLAEWAEPGWRFPWKSPEEVREQFTDGVHTRKLGWIIEQEGDRIRLVRDGLPRPAEACLPWHMPVWTGTIPAAFQYRRESRRSHQFTGSFTVSGPLTEHLIGDHDNRPNQPLRAHPLHRLKEARGRILLLGVDHRSNSTIHVAQQIVLDGRNIELVEGGTEFVGDFQNVDDPLDRAGGQRRGAVGAATARLVDTGVLYRVVAGLLDARITEGLAVRARTT